MRSQIFFKIILTTAFAFFYQFGFGQFNRDSIAYHSATNLKGKLDLSDAAFLHVLNAEKEKRRLIDSLGKQTQNAEQRRTALTGIIQQFHDRLKNILTPDQWNKLVQQENAARDNFMKEMQAKKMPVKELPQQ
jgi:hypothetical protein